MILNLDNIDKFGQFKVCPYYLEGNSCADSLAEAADKSSDRGMGFCNPSVGQFDDLRDCKLWRLIQGMKAFADTEKSEDNDI